MGNSHAIGPNKVLVVSGGCRWPRKRILAGSGFIWTCFVGSKVQELSLNLMTLTPECEGAETAEGVQVNVSAVAQCKVCKERELLVLAAEQFLDRTPEEIGGAVQLTLEGHLRAILSTLTVEEIYKDRVKFASRVKDVAAADLVKMGIVIVSFSIRDICDYVQYLRSLGKAKTAQVIRDAAIGVAEAERDAAIEESRCEKLKMIARYDSYTKIAENDRNYLLQKINCDIEINAAKAEADLAHDLQAMRSLQRIKHEEMQIELVEKRKEIEIMQHEIARKELELISAVRLTTSSEIQGGRDINLGKKCGVKEIAMGESYKIRKIGLAEAGATLAVGTAEAEKSRLRASTLQDYGDAGMIALVLEALPKIVAEVCAPLASIERILLVERGGPKMDAGDMSPGPAALVNSITLINTASRAIT